MIKNELLYVFEIMLKGNKKGIAFEQKLLMYQYLHNHGVLHE